MTSMSKKFLGFYVLGDGFFFLNSYLRHRYNVRHIPGGPRLGCSPHLPGCPLPPRGDGGNPGLRLQPCLSNHKTVQIALVELKRQDPETYKESHPRAYRWMIPEKSILRLCRIPSSCNTQAWSNCRQGRQHRKIPLGSPGCRHRHLHC